MASARRNREWVALAVVAILMMLAAAIGLPAQTLTTLCSFDLTDGADPSAGVVQATDGNFYGTTWTGGAYSSGTVFKITPNGTLTTLHSFDGTDGENPLAGLFQATDRNLYGTTSGGGANGDGTIFRIDAAGTLTTFYSFCSETDCEDGYSPQAGLVQAADGNFYGTTSAGGANNSGTVFKITARGTLSTLYSFCPESNCEHGAYPEAGLIQATDGNLYGTTYMGGDSDFGTVFEITPEGFLTTLYNFCSQSGCTDGAYPTAALVQGADGNLYGTTFNGGTAGVGTVFKITSNGALTTLSSFDYSNGQSSNGALVQATDGNLYGTTVRGGASPSQGTVFKITPSGTLSTLYSFCSQTGCTDGLGPEAGLIQGTDGSLYGTTSGGGASDHGTIFSLSVGLGPFVETEPSSGKAGKVIKILGTNLTGTTSVTFNGTTAVFRVISNSLIGATVPAGASSGTVQVVTPSGTLSSNVPFRVR